MVFVMEVTMHKEIEPAIHYWGTPVVLVSTRNEDGSTNIAPMSSVWWLGYTCLLGLDASSQTVLNLRRERCCVLNLATADNADAVNRLARTTGTPSLPFHKKLLGYRAVQAKAEHAGLTLQDAVAVSAARVREARVQLEAQVISIRPVGRTDPRMAVPACAIEVQILKTHVDTALLLDNDHVDADAWQPLLMSFRRLFVRGTEQGPSRLAAGPEGQYAPWKRGGVIAALAKVAGAVAQHRVGVADETVAEEELQP